MAGLDDFHPTAVEEAPGLWRVFFETAASRDGALERLRSFDERRLSVETIEVEDEDWARRSQAALEPVRAGRFVLTPPWCADTARETASPGDLVVVIAPSTGFGTGHHASTRMCLELLQEVAVQGRTVLDIGTGSGVLAIAAARLGASSVTAIDNDADAVTAARENLALAGVEATVRVLEADFPRPGLPTADIVVANLTGETLRRTAGDIVARTRAGGAIIVSGVLADEQAGVVAAFRSAGAAMLAGKADEEWVALRFGRTT